VFTKLLQKVFGSKNERELNKIAPIIDHINFLEPEIIKLSDDELKKQTQIFKERIDAGQPLDELLPEAFATVREASKRTLSMRHFDSQLIGGIVLHRGIIAEMKTGEGKTLVATLPVYLNALSGKGVHVITVNDYLAKRDTEWMGQIYNYLGLSVGTIVQGLSDKERIEAYNDDITYGTNNEFGFDYLRDNMKFDSRDLVQRDLNYSIVDEVDSILIDEARTPLIISGPAEKSTYLYEEVNLIIPKLTKEKDFTIDEKARTVTLTEDGVQESEKLLKIENLYDPQNIEVLHHVNQALKAHTLFKKDVDYIVKHNEVIIVDEFTGRLMPGRRFSEGLHQALEAKERVKIENENQTLATITFQNYFRMYNKLAGMTGTADTEASEFKKIYNLDVMVIPTNMPMIRNDHADVIYKTKNAKYNAVIDEIIEKNKTGQPVLVGTVSIDVSEYLSGLLSKKKINHSVLNAKNHKKEAEIIAAAGQKSSVTISTNMAGRGTDIVLGEGVKELGGLHVLGTERHESRRIDNQLRGRSGRQGDPGSSRFYLALEDDLLRIFGGDKITSFMNRIGMEEGDVIEHNLISRAIENAQKKVEGRNFDIRKHLLEYDDVMNQQREVIYQQRREALSGEDLEPSIKEMILELAEDIGFAYGDEKLMPEEWNWDKIQEETYKQFGFYLEKDKDILDGLNDEGLGQWIYEEASLKYDQKKKEFEEEFKRLEHYVMLQTVDKFWKDHLLNMDHLKEGIGLRGYAQQNPLIVYKKEGFEMFQEMIFRIKEETISLLFKIQIYKGSVLEENQKRHQEKLVYSHGDDSQKSKPVKRQSKKIGRNSPCPCGSGKKYKKCCGKNK